MPMIFQVLIKLIFLVLLATPGLNAFASPTQKTLTTPAESLIPMLYGLVTILAVIFFLAFIFKRFSNFGLNNKSIKIIENLAMGNKEKIMIIQVGKQQFLIGVTNQNINLLSELEKQPISVPEKSKSRQKGNGKNTRFNHLITNLIKGSVSPFEQQERSK